MDYHDKYLKYKNKYLKLKFLEQKNSTMHGGSNPAKATLNLFKAEWCGHCINFKPIWEKIQTEKSNNISFKSYDADKDKQAIKSFNIEGFPTLILTQGNKAIEYVGNRDYDSIIEFISTYT
jgi:thiol-disulfide isomerase/thioredoxin